MEFVIPAKAGIQLFQDVLDPGACPGPDPGFAGVTTQETFYETINIPRPFYSVKPSWPKEKWMAISRFEGLIGAAWIRFFFTAIQNPLRNMCQE